MSSEMQAFIIQHLNKKPFESTYTQLQFDQLLPQQLLQLLSDVLSWIFQTEKVDVRRETAEDTAIRILHSLKILRFKPPLDIEELEEWRAGIVEGVKKSVYPVLHYIFSNTEMLKERAYLAKYLMKTDVPSDVHDFDTAQLQNEISELMERFKELHAEVVEIKTDVLMLGDIKQDLRSMEQEKEALGRKIEKAERKIKDLPFFEKHMNNAAHLRVERERISEYTLHKTQERHRVIAQENKANRWRAYLEELQTIGDNLDPTEMIIQLEDELATNTYLAEVQLGEEIRSRRNRIEELSVIARMSAISEKDITQLNTQIAEISASIRRLEEERDRKEEPIDENMSVFRHQATALERKKAAAAQKLQQTRQDLLKIESDVAARKKELQNKVGGEVISAVQFRKYVENLRAKTAEYKKKRAEIEEMHCEKAILKRTVDLLVQRFERLRSNIENSGGEVVEVLQVPQGGQRPKTAAPKSENIEELQQMATKIISQLDSKKDQIELLRKKKAEKSEILNEKIERVESLQKLNSHKKEHFRTANNKLIEEIRTLEERSKSVKEKLPSVQEELATVLEDRNQLSKFDNQDYEEQLHQVKSKIDEANELFKSLTTGSGSLTSLAAAKKQVDMWRALVVIFEAKLELVRDSADTEAGNEHPYGDRTR